MLVALLAATTTSCLEKYPDSAIPTDKAMKSFSDAEQLVTGIYALLKSSSLFSGYATLAPDIQADLVYAVDGYTNQYGNIWLWDLRTTTAEVEAVYAGFYSVISNCNFYLENVEAVRESIVDDDKITMLDYYTGEVYTIRALCYSELIKFFCKAYDPATAADELGVVLRKTYSGNEEAVRASLYDSYQFVLEDLAHAERLLDSENDNHSSAYATRAMAEALHARVALYMQDWQSAIDYSTRLIENDRFALSSASSIYTGNQTFYQYMWNYDVSTEVIWRIYFTSTSYGGALGSPFLHFTNDYYYYYPDYVPAQSLLDLYASNDGRYRAFFYTTTTGYEHGLEWPLLVKYHGNGDFINQYKLYHISMPKPFRLSEQYLIRAEAYCRQDTPNFAKASADLTELRSQRYASGGSINVTEKNFQQQIADERARELVMEGHRLHDLKRWGMGFERTPQQHSLAEGSILKIEAGDYRFVWPIPRREIEAPGSNVKQNDGY